MCSFTWRNTVLWLSHLVWCGTRSCRRPGAESSSPGCSLSPSVVSVWRTSVQSDEMSPVRRRCVA
ncbi:hypothetical protein PF008_g26536 [Phytophthora fragariae]|uniref:Secreted protein n=1 Tax=Phytophthora fragariae TaxID=53985 RepID=A0A6G0QHH7_9STRA|nr:hypothetical protein PF008_g26536 [Phytophthora fragariae]